MPSKLEDYALIGDCEAAALVGRDGSIDWLCLPRFDSSACFAALLGTSENGRWILSPTQKIRTVQRRYRGDTLVLETRYETDSGTIAILDFMPVRGEFPVLVRIVEGVSGTVPMHMQFILRLDYGRIVPWVQCQGQAIRAIGGPDGVVLQSDVAVHGKDLTTVADFDVTHGQRVAFAMQWFPSHRAPPKQCDTNQLLDETETWWHEWAGRAVL